MEQEKQRAEHSLESCISLDILFTIFFELETSIYRMPFYIRACLSADKAPAGQRKML